ncbi:Smr/MutS family protein [Bacteroidota bacterium]
MHVGDRVRLLHDKEEGIIRRILDDRLVEVEIDDGFIIPVLIKELVSIASHEKNTFKKEEGETILRQEVRKITSDQGIYLLFEQKNDNDLDLNLINNTELDILYRVFTADKDIYTGLSAGHMGADSYSLITFLKFSELNDWPEYNFELMFFKKGEFKSVESIRRSIRFKPKLFTRDKQTAPILKKSGYLFQLDSSFPQPDPEKLKEAFFENDSEQSIKDEVEGISEKSIMVDLHIESLIDNYESLNSGEILEIQLTKFEKALDEGLKNGQDSMIFIHGVGNGTLRNKIHKRLSNLSEISYYEDAQKDKFGFGATKVTFK